MIVPAGKCAVWEMIQPEVGLQLAILLLDRPPLMREPDEPRSRRRGRQVHEVIRGLRRVARVAFAQQPHLRREPPLVAPVLTGLREKSRRSRCTAARMTSTRSLRET